MSSNDGLNLVAIVAGVRAIVDAVDTALELYHRLPVRLDDAGQLEVGDRVTLGASLESWSHRWALGAWVGGTIREATGHTLEARAALGPLGLFITYDGGDDDLEALDVVDLDEAPDAFTWRWHDLAPAFAAAEAGAR